MNELQHTTKVGFLADIRKGRATSGQLEETSKGLPLISMEYLRNLSDDVVTSKLIQPTPSDVIVSWGDILILWDGSNAGEFLKSKEGVLSSTLAKLTISKKINKEYFFYALKSIEPLIKNECVGMGIPHVNGRFLKTLKIRVHSIDQQKKIADFLDRETARIDRLIEKKNVFITIVREKNFSLSNQALNGSIIGLDSSNEKSWFGSLPHAWQARRAKFLFKEAQGRSVAGDEELLTVSHITGVTKRSEKDVNMFMAESMEGYKLVAKSDVIINTMWAWMGAMGVSPHEGLISPSYGVYRPLKKSFEDEYLDLIIRSKAFIAEVTRRSKGIHSSRLRLYPDSFLDILFPVPPLEDQRKILHEYNQKTSKENKLVQINLKSIELLKEFRTSLITETVTGQLDIQSWQKRGMGDRRSEKIEKEMEKKKWKKRKVKRPAHD